MAFESQAEYDARVKKVVDELNATLRLVKTWEEFQAWQKTMDEPGLGLCLYSRRRPGCYAYAFSPLPFGRRLHYLLDDGVSTGRCLPENLWKVLFVRY